VTSRQSLNWLEGAARRAVLAYLAGIQIGKQPRQAMVPIVSVATAALRPTGQTATADQQP
jgi:hypothetical protein